MGLDTYCPISGLHWFDRLTVCNVRNLYLLLPDETCCLLTQFVYHVGFKAANGNDDPDDDNALDAHSVLERGITHSADDAEHSANYVMICVDEPPKTAADLDHSSSIFGNYQCVDIGPAYINESNTTEVFNLRAGKESGEVDEYNSLDLTDEEGRPLCYLHHCFGTGLAVNFWAYLILRHACPKVLPHILFKMHRDQTRSVDKRPHNGTFWGVDYGPTRGTTDQYVDWRGLGQSHEGDEILWSALLYREKPIPEILDDAWNGDGSLWTTVRPNNFPIAEAASTSFLVKFPVEEVHPRGGQAESRLTACPLDILLEIARHLSPRQTTSLLVVSKNMRHSLIHHSNHITYQYIQRNQPWLLPAGPVPFSDSRFGHEEVNEWVEGWAKAGIDPKRIEMDIPWLAYARACSNSMSMRSRRRIWGIAKQIEELAIQGDYI